jgi:hypothetical protein
VVIAGVARVGDAAAQPAASADHARAPAAAGAPGAGTAASDSGWSPSVLHFCAAHCATWYLAND